MKVVLVDNYDRETVEDLLLAENVSQEEAEQIADAYNEKQTDSAPYWAVVKNDDYRLWRGMRDVLGEPDMAEETK